MALVADSKMPVAGFATLKIFVWKATASLAAKGFKLDVYAKISAQSRFIQSPSLVDHRNLQFQMYYMDVHS